MIDLIVMAILMSEPLLYNFKSGKATNNTHHTFLHDMFKERPFLAHVVKRYKNVRSANNFEFIVP
jgi:hypothetical protein